VLRVELAADFSTALDEAVRAALRDGDELRAMRAAFPDLVGLHPDPRSPWIAAEFTRATVTELAARIARTDRRPAGVYVVPPGAVPDPDPSVPLLLALTGRERAIALRAAPAHHVVLDTDGPIAYRGATRVEPPG